MSRVKVSDLSKEEKIEMTREFFDIVTKLETREEVTDFFVGMLNQSEAIMFGRRIKVAKALMLDMTYAEIVRELGVGKSLITKTDKWMHTRDEKYKKVLLKHLKDKSSLNKGSKNNSKFFDLDKYPGHKLAKSIFGV